MENISTPGTHRRIRRNREQWQALVARFEESGQTREQFCAEMDIGLSTLRRWCSRFRERTPRAVSRAPAPVFVELPADPNRTDASVPAWEVELQLDAGMVLRLRRAAC
jgi:transposase-like protein